MTKIRFLDIAIDDIILSEVQRNSFFYLKMLVKMYKLENKIETTTIIKFKKTGAVNVHSNAFIFA